MHAKHHRSGGSSAARVVGVMLAVVLTAMGLTACSWSQPQSVSGSTASVHLGTKTVLHVPGGPVVTIGADATSADGTLSVRPVSKQLAAGAGAVAGWTISLAHAKLVRPVTIAFPFHAAKGEPAPIVAYNESLGDPLHPVGGHVSGASYVVQTSHFSNWFEDTWSSVLDKATAALRLIYASDGDAKAPTCSGTSTLKADGYTVGANASDKSVLWCAGEHASAPRLVVVNGRGYPVVVEATPGLSESSTSGVKLDEWLPKLVSKLQAKLKKGDSMHFLGAGSSVTLDATSATTVGVDVTGNPGALLASDLIFAGETLLTIEGIFGVKAKSLQSVVTALGTADCLYGLESSTPSSLSSVTDAANYVKKVIPVAFGCLAEQIKDEFGILAGIAAAGLSWLVSGLKLVLDSVFAVKDAITHLNGYQIAITPPAPTLDLLTLPIPAMCNAGPSRLKDGTVSYGKDPKYGADKGGASLVAQPGKSDSNKYTLWAKQSGSGAAYAAVPIWCTAGGVDWPQTIAVYSASGNLLASVDLGPIANQEHAWVTSLSLHGDTVSAKFDAFDGADFDHHYWTGDFTLSGGKLIASHLSTTAG